MKRFFIHTGRLAIAMVVIALSIPGCTPSGGADSGNGQALATDSLTRRQKDSIVSTLPIPGAGVVGKALRASDQALERAVAHDTIR